jgi:hypothetical protein
MKNPPKPKLPRRGSKLEDEFAWQLKAAHPEWHVYPEFEFDENRKWRSHFSILYYPPSLFKRQCLVEIAGGTKTDKYGKIVTFGRHTRGAGYSVDIEKYNTATILGFKVIRGTGDHVRSGQLLKWVEEALS